MTDSDDAYAMLSSFERQRVEENMNSPILTVFADVSHNGASESSPCFPFPIVADDGVVHTERDVHIYFVPSKQKRSREENKCSSTVCISALDSNGGC